MFQPATRTRSSGRVSHTTWPTACRRARTTAASGRPTRCRTCESGYGTVYARVTVEKEPDIYILAALLGVPGGLGPIQRISAPREAGQKTESE